mmetsp:Transcript_11734/g.33794  ORF Transcript_11734/g.33794 Transcript_11734/m.33794 type:complete len:209 (+) Transcript_11734:56-682(+)
MWSCTRCTYANERESARCAMCDQSRPTRCRTCAERLRAELRCLFAVFDASRACCFACLKRPTCWCLLLLAVAMAIGTAAGGAPNKVAEATLAAAALVGLTCGPAIFVCMWSRRLQRQRREQLLRAFHEPETVAGHGRPATGRDLAQALPVEQVAELQTGQTCTICLETFARGHSVQTMPCFHRFHAECLQRWLAESTLCPVCQHRATL